MKKILIVILTLTLIITMAGCEQSKQTANTAADNTINEVSADKNASANDQISKNYDFQAADLAAYIYANNKFKDQLSEINSNVLFEIYDVDKDEVKDACSYFSTGATAEEITVMTAADSNIQDNLAEINKAYNERLEDQIEAFSDYVPEELTKLSNPLIMEIGNSVVMVVCDDYDRAKQTILDYFK